LLIKKTIHQLIKFGYTFCATHCIISGISWGSKKSNYTHSVIDFLKEFSFDIIFQKKISYVYQNKILVLCETNWACRSISRKCITNERNHKIIHGCLEIFTWNLSRTYFWIHIIFRKRMVFHHWFQETLGNFIFRNLVGNNDLGLFWKYSLRLFCWSTK